MFPDFRYYLKASDTLYYKVVNGNILTEIVKTELVDSPKDWIETGIDFNRDKLYFGVFLEVTEPTQFGGDGAKILRYIKANQSYEGECIFRIERLISNNLTYELCYEGNLDFSTMHDGIDFVTINCLNRGLQEDLNAQEDTTFELDLNATEALTLTIDGTFVRSKGSWYPGNYSESASDTEIQSALPFYTIDSIATGRAMDLYNNSTVDQIFSFIRPHGQQVRGAASIGNAAALITEAFNTSNPSPSDGYYLFQAATDIKNFVVDGSRKIKNAYIPPMGGTKTLKIKAIVFDLATNTVDSSTTLFEYSTIVSDFTIPLITTIEKAILPPILSGRYLLIIGFWQAPVAVLDNQPAYFPIENGYFNIYFDAKISPTDTKCLRYYNAANQLISKISPASTFVSTYFNTAQTDATSRFNNFDTSPYYQVLMSGDALTQKSNPKIKTSWKEMWADINSRDAMSLSIENNNAVIEKLDYVFSNEKLATIESVSNIDWYDFPDNIFSNLKIGFPDANTNTQSGQQEFLTTSGYLSNARRYKGENNSVTSYIAANSQIEEMRSYTLNQTDATTLSNNDTFITEIDPTPTVGKYKLYRPPGSISGITDTVNAYGLTITAGRAVNRKRAFFRSSIPFGQLTFQTSTKNQNLVSSFFAGIITENANIPLDSDTYLGHAKPRYFLPYLVEFDCVPTVNLLNIVKNNPKGYIEYNHYGNMVGGYIYEMNFKPATNECHLILILRADTNMNLFIR